MLKICSECVNKDYEYCDPKILSFDCSVIPTACSVRCAGYKKKEEYRYINIYKDRNGELYPSGVCYETREMAEDVISIYNDYIKTVKIQVN